MTRQVMASSRVQERMKFIRRQVVEKRHLVEVPLEYRPLSLQVRSDGSRSTKGGVLIRLSKPVPVYDYPEGERKVYARTSVHTALFTAAGKMDGFSFSLPAGLPRLSGGVCDMASERILRNLERRAEGFFDVPHDPLHPRPKKDVLVCETCYALKNRYTFVSSNRKLAIVREWTRKALASGLLHVHLEHAISFLQRFDDFLHRNLLNTRFFRFFDAGDIPSNALFAAIHELAMSKPDTMFWVPTRRWVYREFRDLVEYLPALPNLSVRPSALFVGARPPMIPGFAAGTSIHAPGDEEAASKSGIWVCPAYSGERAESCEANHTGRACRRCWTHPDSPVSYRWH